MHTLIVVTNPEPESLSHHVAERLADAAQSVDPGHTAEVVDLSANGFNPSFTLEDRTAYLAAGGYPEDVLAEQARIERAQHLVLVFPVYWYGFPGLLKGWVDRVFAHGWAYGYGTPTEGGGQSGSGLLQGLTIHLVPVVSGEQGKFERHGYLSAIERQIEHGIVDYCGATRGINEYIWRSETSPTENIESRITEITESFTAHLTGAEQQVLAHSLEH